MMMTAARGGLSCFPYRSYSFEFERTNFDKDAKVFIFVLRGLVADLLSCNVQCLLTIYYQSPNTVGRCLMLHQ